MDINDSMPEGIPEFPDFEEHDIPEVMPMMAVRDVVVFNYMIIPPEKYKMILLRLSVFSS